jgi:alkanesulfonate monooxygenase SsuD/methylene tetrahydromethanopterin reductase-like flavin-dependent oxidoreductase (luciferase family)
MKLNAEAGNVVRHLDASAVQVGYGGPTTGRNRRAPRRSEEQVEVMHTLWAEPHVTFKGKWHTIEDAGIKPRPARSTCSASCAP